MKLCIKSHRRRDDKDEFISISEEIFLEIEDQEHLSIRSIQYHPELLNIKFLGSSMNQDMWLAYIILLEGSSKHEAAKCQALNLRHVRIDRK